MRLHSYIVEHDVGFAPNPFHGVCTLATCKPRIRRYASVGEFIIGTGAKKRGLQGRLVYIMKVGEIVGFDEYWVDPRFAMKKPVMNGSICQVYGDNIYHRQSNGSGRRQEDSFHSREGGLTNEDNLRIDTGSTDRVLIADWFIYWGGEGSEIPSAFGAFVHKTQGHKLIDNKCEISHFVEWALSKGQVNSVIGDPSEWSFETRSSVR